jgi:WS/DGAT/MGAT family acyltransferase
MTQTDQPGSNTGDRSRGDGPPGLSWGADPGMSAFEIVMWRVDVDPKLRSTMMGVEILDSVPDTDRFIEAHEWATRMAPRLRERVVAPLFGTGTPHWALDPDFDLHYHLRFMSLPSGGGWRQLWELAEQSTMTPLDPQRPLWEVTLVSGLPDGRAGYFIKLHHALGDGLGITQLLSGLHSRTRDHTDDKPWPDLPAKGTQESIGNALLRQVTDDVSAVGSAAGSAVRSVLGGLGQAVRHPRTTVDDALAWTASARRVLSPPPGTPSPLLAPRSGTLRFRAVDVEFADFRAAGKVVGGTVNDAYLAALMGAFRLYHERMGHPVAPDATMPVSVPVSVRRDDDAQGGNHFAPGRLAGPIGVVGAEERVGAVHAAMALARAEPALESADVFTPLLSRLPGEFVSRIAGDMTKQNDLQASNVPGLREDVFLAGAKIERIYPFAPLPGCAAMISMVTHGSTCCIGANLDGAAISDQDLFARCLVDGFAEVLALHPGAAPPVWRN